MVTDRRTFLFAPPQGCSFSVDDVNGSVITLYDQRGKTPVKSLWDVRSGQEVGRSDEGLSYGFGLRRTSPGWLVAFDSRVRPGEILLYDLVRQGIRGRVPGVIDAGGNFNMETRSALSPDGRLLAAYAATRRRQGPQHDPGLGRRDRAETGHAPGVQESDLTPNGRFLVTIASGLMGHAFSPKEAVIKVWEVADPTPTYRQNGPVVALSWSGDGRRLAVDDSLWSVRGDSPTRLQGEKPPVPADLFAFTGKSMLYAMRLRKPDNFPFKAFDQPIPFWSLNPNAVISPWQPLNI